MRIKNLGIDAVEIKRFAQWHLYKKNTLLRFFTEQELDYVLACPQKSAERFATRFATKEAVYKSISALISDSFFTAARHIEVIKMETGSIMCQIDWKHLHPKSDSSSFDVHQKEVLVSVTHTATTAIAIVLIQ